MTRALRLGAGRRRRTTPTYVRALTGVMTTAVLAAVIALAVTLFRGGFTSTVPVTVLSSRAGLVMNTGAKVELHGAQVGKVDSIDSRPDGTAVLHLAMDPATLHLIPDNVAVTIQSTTVFGAKFVQLAAPTPPSQPSTTPLRAGQVIDARNVTVEFNTIFEQLTRVLAHITPDKLNETLGALASAFNGRGHQFGHTLDDLDSFLSKLDPSNPTLEHELATAPAVLRAYADASPDLLTTLRNTTRIGRTLVDRQSDLDALLISSIGLSDIGNDVVGTNRQPLTDVLHLLVPTTDLTNKYHESLNCGVAGLLPLAQTPPSPVPGLFSAVGFGLGIDRYRFPSDLPKVAAKGGPHCQEMGLPRVAPGARPPFLVADVGSNPAKYGNPGIVLNSDALKQFLFGPIDGPPRNSGQIGQPG
jgi:phospholipid/cholesterol/gamma-HCH transport system substrate-binding protein